MSIFRNSASDLERVGFLLGSTAATKISLPARASVAGSEWAP